MDHPGLGSLKIAQILPEFHEGGVERHVLWLSNELAAMGHQVTVTAGGKLEDKLDPSVSSGCLSTGRTPHGVLFGLEDRRQGERRRMGYPSCPLEGTGMDRLVGVLDVGYTLGFYGSRPLQERLGNKAI